ncbi:divalent-cation tolerance protein CutA [Halomicroarcula sp. GCM10025709]|uniref:divalent-cation tolerance protein CutA n=1 Tax=Haloarcula TaxID=2237 RepID=UPI0024C3A757|nr:divalent-cation tolerance protein CutA [Halomicroarcula sp. YJ-61-S]
MPTVYITAPPDAAPRIARELVEERFAACVNRVDCASTYRWDDEIHQDDEEILLAKTTAERYPALVEHVEATHPYETPCIERFDEAETVPLFAEWRANATDG